jgi:transposase
MRFKELMDEQWSLIQHLSPPRRNGSGKPRADDGRTINAILCVPTTGCRWMGLPSQYGDELRAWRTLKRWEEQGDGSAAWILLSLKDTRVAWLIWNLYRSIARGTSEKGRLERTSPPKHPIASGSKLFRQIAQSLT